MAEHTTPRGMSDIGAEEMERRLWIQSKIEPVIRSYGFRRVEPTFVEHLDTLIAKSGESILQEIYYFKDKAGRDLGLRFDLTVGMARMVANDYKSPEPIKLYAISPMWRYDEPQAGRYRCFWQWDVETYGPREPYADAEVISLGIDTMDSVGLQASAHISHRMLLEGIVRALGAKTDEQVKKVFTALDKARKISREQLCQLLAQAGLPSDAAQTLLDLVQGGLSLDSLKAKLDGEILKHLETPLYELDTLWDELDSLGKNRQCVFDLSIVRGLDYYDGIVFEGFAEDSNLALFGGGRYNSLTALYGNRHLPATGVAGGIERLMLALEQRGMFAKLEEYRPKRVFLANTAQDTRRDTLNIAVQLRKRGVVAEYALKDWPLRRQLSYADTAGFTHVLIVGRKEISTGTFVLKELKSGLQVEKTLQEIIDLLAPP